MNAIYKFKVTKFELVLAGGKYRPLIQGIPITIGLYDPAGQIAQIFFHTDASSMPEEDATPPEGDELTRFVKSHYLMSDYANVYALLSGSQPVYCGHTRTPPQVWLTNDPKHASDSSRE